jgi:hypothetical protein
MNRNYYFLLVFTFIFFQACAEKINTEFNANNLRCEYMEDAIVAKASPRFGWQVNSTESMQKQTAWQLIVSDNLDQINSGNGNVWDSEKTTGNNTFGIKWKGEKLQSFTKYYWKVKVWDINGAVSNWSETASFITGAFNKSDWKANWKRFDLPIEAVSNGWWELSTPIFLVSCAASRITLTYDIERQGGEYRYCPDQCNCSRISYGGPKHIDAHSAEQKRRNRKRRDPINAWNISIFYTQHEQ